MRTGFPFQPRKREAVAGERSKGAPRKMGSHGMVFLLQVSVCNLIVVKDCTTEDWVVADRKIGRLEPVDVGHGPLLHFTNSEHTRQEQWGDLQRNSLLGDSEKTSDIWMLAWSFLIQTLLVCDEVIKKCNQDLCACTYRSPVLQGHFLICPDSSPVLPGIPVHPTSICPHPSSA